MLQQLLDAAVAEPFKEGKLHRLLEQLVAQLEAQAGVLVQVEQGLDGIGSAAEH